MAKNKEKPNDFTNHYGSKIEMLIMNTEFKALEKNSKAFSLCKNIKEPRLETFY